MIANGIFNRLLLSAAVVLPAAAAHGAPIYTLEIFSGDRDALGLNPAVASDGSFVNATNVGGNSRQPITRRGPCLASGAGSMSDIWPGHYWNGGAEAT